MSGDAQPAVPRPAPDLACPALAPFWEAAAEHRLVVRRCAACGRLQWPPQPRCGGCAGNEFEWTPVDARGELRTHFTATRSFHPGFAAATPYTVGIVRLECGVSMLGQVLEPDGIAVGAAMEAAFVDTPGAATLVCWRTRDE